MDMVTHPTGPSLVGEEGEGVRREDERNTLMGGETGEVGLETASVQEGIEGGKVFSEVRMEDRTREEDVCHIVQGK